jgi:methionine synthase I (cobalamin-dependent)
MPASILERFQEGKLLFDGGMGSMLIGKGLAAGWPPEEWNVSHRDEVRSVHDYYMDAGAEVVETNTFGGTPTRLLKHGYAERTAEFNAAGIAVARAAVAKANSQSSTGRRRFVAFSMGPGGEMFPPVGNADEGIVREEFLEQLSGADENNMPDMVLIETMLDVREALVAVEAARSALELPIAVSMTYNRNPRGFYTVMGNEAKETTRALADAGVDVIAANCSIASGDMLALAPTLRESTDLPVLCQPNAGKPGVRDGKPVYEQTAEEFAAAVAELFSLGINAVGGCCGTTPEFIRLAAAVIDP